MNARSPSQTAKKKNASTTNPRRILNKIRGQKSQKSALGVHFPKEATLALAPLKRM